MDISEIYKYASLMRELGLTAFEVHPDGTIRLERGAKSALSEPGPEAAPAAPPVPAGDGADLVVTSPMVGMFYISPAENADPFVQPGAAVHKGDVLCIIEAMKLMNEIVSESDGVLEEVLAVNGAVVEFGQPLFRIKKELP